jgi:hypothetical protein
MSCSLGRATPWLIMSEVFNITCIFTILGRDFFILFIFFFFHVWCITSKNNFKNSLHCWNHTTYSARNSKLLFSIWILFSLVVEKPGKWRRQWTLGIILGQNLICSLWRTKFSLILFKNILYMLAIRYLTIGVSLIKLLCLLIINY